MGVAGGDTEARAAETDGPRFLDVRLRAPPAQRSLVHHESGKRSDIYIEIDIDRDTYIYSDIEIEIDIYIYI